MDNSVYLARYCCQLISIDAGHFWEWTKLKQLFHLNVWYDSVVHQPNWHPAKVVALIGLHDEKNNGFWSKNTYI